MSNEDKIKEIIAEQFCVDLNIVKDNANLVDDLGADSLDLVELIMALEEFFDVEIADEVAEKVTTVSGVVDGICDMI